MTPDEIVKALREMLPPKVDYAKLVCAEGLAHGQCYVWDDPEPYIISAAADLIKSMQAQLAESQRGEKAAVEDLNGLARFEKERCAYCLYDEECEPGEMLCSYKGDKAFEWRGPQEAGEGEAK